MYNACYVKRRSILIKVWIAMIVGTLAAGDALASDLADLTGVWRDTRYGALVDIGDCGNGTPCGWLTWVDARLTEGQIQDVRNREPLLRTRGLVGLPVLWNFASGPEGWRDGRLYNPDDGKTFRAHLHLLSAGELRVTGCLGLLCRSQVWTRFMSVHATRGPR
jgi:uncharacterized protein (DUF2147 family)